MSQASQAIFQGISLLLTQRRTAEARVELERLLALDPDDPEARAQAGDVYAYTGAHSAAYKQYNQAADTYNRLGRADMALAVHHKILELDLLSLDSATQTRLRLLGLLVAAEDAIVAGQFEKAVSGYHEAISRFPNHTISYQRLASLLVRLNRVAEAAEQYLVVARAFYAHGVRAKARPYFERVLELKPEHAEALDSLLDCLKHENRQADGARFVRAGVQALLQSGELERARLAFGVLASLGEASAAEPLEAALLLQSGEPGQAERCAARLSLQDEPVRALFKSLGRSALDRGDSVSADAYFRWAQGRSDSVQGQAPAPPVPAPAEAPRTVSPVPEAVLAAKAPSTAASPVPPEDQAVLRTLGEVCLAEGMFEHASTVFERLAASRPDYPVYAELLKRAKSGLAREVPGPGLPQASPPVAVVAPPAPAEVQGPRLEPALHVPAILPIPSPTLSPLPPPPLADALALAPAEKPAPPSPGLKAPADTLPQLPAWPIKIPKRKIPATLPSVPILRTAHVLSFGELPTVSIGPIDDSDELIE